MTIIEIYKLERDKWVKLPLTSIVNGDRIVMGKHCRIVVNGEEIYIS